MRARRLELLRIGDLDADPELPRWLARQLHRRLGLSVRLDEPIPLYPDWLDEARGQYDSGRIVDSLIRRDQVRPHPAGRWVLGLTEADLFAADRDFVFGEAALGGSWALISLARLRPDPAAARPAPVLRRRALKEAVHEIGHLAGLTHCPRPECVMFPSLGVRETDHKTAAFCPACRGLLPPGQGLDPPQSRR